MVQHANVQLANSVIHSQADRVQLINVLHSDLARHRRFASMDAVNTNAMVLSAVWELIATRTLAVVYAKHSS